MMTERVSATVLVVEDDPAIREYIAFVLDDAGYKQAWAANGQEALAYLRSHAAPTLILLDLMMPIMDGRAFRAEQQRDPALADIPVVMLTASTNGDTSAHELGAAGYLPKPMLPDEIVATVARYQAN